MYDKFFLHTECISILRCLYSAKDGACTGNGAGGSMIEMGCVYRFKVVFWMPIAVKHPRKHFDN